jgi:hypothetical protein
MTSPLEEIPIIHSLEGERELQWGNKFAEMHLTPSVYGPHIAITAAGGKPFLGLATLVTDGTRILLVCQQRWASGSQPCEIPGGGMKPMLMQLPENCKKKQES